MGLVERIQNLPGQRERLLQRQRSGQRLALDVLHDQVIRPNVVQRADMGMIQRRNRMRLALEPLAETVTACLDSNDAAQARVARLPNLPHPTLAQWREDFVRPKSVTRAKRHAV